MRNHKDTPLTAGPDRDIALLVERMGRAGKCSRERIIEDSSGPMEIDAVRLDSLRPASDSQGPPNTEIRCDDRGILAFAGFVSFISLLGGVEGPVSGRVGVFGRRRPPV